MLASLLNFLLLQAAWATCVLGAAARNGLVGPLVTLGLLAMHVAASKDRRAELRAILLAAAVGTLVDSGLVAAGFLRFSAGGPLDEVLVPIWIVSLWAAFGATFRGALAWLAPRPFLAAALSSVGGPLGFASARALGAVELAEPLPATLAVLALEYALLVPLLLRATRIGATHAEPRQRRAESEASAR